MMASGMLIDPLGLAGRQIEDARLVAANHTGGFVTGQRHRKAQATGEITAHG